MDGGVGAVSLAWFIFLKNGFLVSAPYEDDDDSTGAGGGGRAGAAGGAWMGAEGGLIGAPASTKGANGGDERSDGWVLLSLESTWLFVGVVSCGVISWGPSSSDESSSPRLSNCNCSCRSRSFAASSSAR